MSAPEITGHQRLFTGLELSQSCQEVPGWVGWMTNQRGLAALSSIGVQVCEASGGGWSAVGMYTLMWTWELRFAAVLSADLQESGCRSVRRADVDLLGRMP